MPGGLVRLAAKGRSPIRTLRVVAALAVATHRRHGAGEIPETQPRERRARAWAWATIKLQMMVEMWVV